MSVRYRPTVAINDVTVAGTQLGDGLLPLASIEVTWGQDDIYDPTKPATLKAAFLDETGAWSTDNALVGAKIVVTRDPGVIVFRGTIGNVEVDEYAVQDDEGTVHEVYRTTVIATCPLADLDMAVVPGPGTASTHETFLYGTDFWPDNSLNAIRANLLNGGPRGGVLRHVSGMDSTTNNVPGVGTGLGGRRYLASEGMSLLEMVKRYFAVIALSHVIYNPTTHALEIGKPAPSSGLALVLTGGIIKLSPIAGYVVPAAKVIVDRAAVIRSTVLNAIDAILVRTVRPATSYGGPDTYGNYFEAGSITQPVQSLVRTANSRADKTLALDVTVRPTNALPNVLTDLAGQIAAYADGINNQFAMPPVSIDFRRFDLGDGLLDALLLDTKSHVDPLYFVGSRFNHLNNIGPQFQLIGGRLRWLPQERGSLLEAGWVHELTLAPTVGVIANVTIDNLVTNAGPAIEDFDPDITLADLGTITTGLA